MSNIRLYFPDNIVENTTSLLSKEHTHYVTNVMRMKRGSNINFFNKEGEWLSEIIFLDRDRVEVKFLNKIKESSKLLNIELAICLVKKNPMELILQKATELGVSRITPIIYERTEIKELNYERARKIVIEATEQYNQLNTQKNSTIIKLHYLDCLGYFLYYLNKIFFKNEIYPSKVKIFIWDKFFTPITFFLDKFLNYKFGKNVLCIIKKN